MAIASAMIVTLYLGGYQVPYIEKLGLSYTITTIIQIAAFLIKIGALLFFFMWVRWSIPRFRYDQLMSLGWKVMFPLALVNIIWVAVLIMIFGL
jgi:NADH-quinone oxidoreductase subunit H